LVARLEWLSPRSSRGRGYRSLSPGAWIQTVNLAEHLVENQVPLVSARHRSGGTSTRSTGDEAMYRRTGKRLRQASTTLICDNGLVQPVVKTRSTGPLARPGFRIRGVRRHKQLACAGLVVLPPFVF
jgi:hypothetical protein